MSYAAGELIIVTAGVLIALAIDQWNDDRLNRAEELKDLALRAKRTLPQDIVIAEINFSRFVSQQLVATKAIHEDLCGALQAYRDAIR